MPTFLCFLNWTDQLLSAYVTTGQYDVVINRGYA
jgi:hypothetical protein